MFDLAGLDKILDGKRRERLAQLSRRHAESMQAPSLAGAQFGANRGEGRLPHDRWKCLRKSIHRSDDANGPCDPGAIEQIRDQRRWQQRHINGEKDGILGLHRLKSRTDAGQWTAGGGAQEALARIVNDGRKLRKLRSCACGRRRETGLPKDVQRPRDQGLAVQLDERFVCSHAARLPARQDKSGSRISLDRVGPLTQPPASSRKRIRD